MKGRIHRFLADESGATAVEYSLIAALISIACVVAMRSYGNTFANMIGIADTTMGSSIGG